MSLVLVVSLVLVALLVVTTHSVHPLFETYQGYKDGKIGQRFKDKFDKYIPFEGRDKLRILQIGAKTSDFCERLYEDGFRYIDNIDLIKESMEIMTKRMKKLNIPSNTVSFQIADMFQFGEINNYHIIIDKGVIELTVKGYNKYLPHCYNILKMNGLFITIGPFAPNGNKQNGWWLSDDMSPSNWEKNVEIKNGFKLIGIESINNTYIRVPNPDKFYMYFLQKIEKDKSIENKQEV